ncbi:MAG: bacillithiol biosynthesis cysteine-adding enzyme BshC [Bacteroidota bacterium]
MKKITINRNESEHFSAIANALVYDQDQFKAFIHRPFSKAAVVTQTEEKQRTYSAEMREVLKGVVKEQMEPFMKNEKVHSIVESIGHTDTFTVTTGHQLNIYSGPLYVIYKIMHVIKLAEELNRERKDFNYVPVFWMASEDHDFEEINHFHLFNDKIEWSSAQQGAVGRFDLEDFSAVKDAIADKFQNNETMHSYLMSHYRESESLATATRRFIMDLFKDYGLIVLDADDYRLKKAFAPVMEREIRTPFAEELVERQTEALAEKGYDGQVTPRPINLFYLSANGRDRIIPEGEGYVVGEQQFTQEALLKALKNHPERFSPNVVLRPVYQEVILPNVAYVGGGGEMAYWLQLKPVFEAADVVYPLIQVRNSVQIVDKIANKKMKKLGLSIKDLFSGIHKVKKEYVLKNSQEELDFSKLHQTKEKLQETIENFVGDVDKALSNYAKSEVTRIEKQIQGIQQKLIRHQKKQHDDAMNQLDHLFERLYPHQQLQERHDNIIQLMATQGKEKITDNLYHAIDPFEKDLIVLSEDSEL